MNTIDVRSLSASNIIRDIAKALNTEYERECEEFTVNLPSEVGSGFITGVDTEGGLGIMLYDCTFLEDTEIRFNIDETHPLKFLYVIKGRLDHFFQNNRKKVHEIEEYQTAILAGDRTNGHILRFYAHESLRMHSLEIDRKIFSERMACDLNNLEGDLKTVFMDVEGRKQFYFRDHFSLELADLFTKMYDFDELDYLRKIYLEGMGYQILIKQIILYMDNQRNEDQRSILRTSEIEKVKQAVEYIQDNITENPGVEEIASSVGLNINKLQYGFKMLHNSTVNKFIHNIRLDIARNLLLHTDYNISEVADSVGLQNKSYFTKVFKKNYRITPSEFQRKNKTRLKKKNSNSGNQEDKIGT